MNYYFIDYENIGENGLSGVDKLGEGDIVALFYSRNAGKISFDMHRKLSATAAKMEYHRVEASTKNALDFQLSSYLGYLISLHPEDKFVIVSKDNGYNAVIAFWKNADISKTVSIRAAMGTAPRGGEVMKSRPVAKRVTKVVAKKRSKRPAVPQAPVAPAPEEEAPMKAPRQTAKNSRKPAQKADSVITALPEKDQIEVERAEKIHRLIEDKEIADSVARLACHYKTKLGINNAIVKLYGTEKAGEIYRTIKPLLKDKKGN